MSRQSSSSPIMVGQAVELSELSSLARLLMRVVVILFALIGLVLFLAPDWAAANFLWKISPFVAMTMGGWYLGMALLGWDVVRVWQWTLVYPAAVLLWVFGLGEAAVLAVHNDKLRLDAPLGWPYLLIILVAAIAAIVGVYDWVRLRPPLRHSGEPVTRGLLIGIIAFGGLVLFIAAFPLAGFGRTGTIFPEPLTVFTLNAFGVFYMSIALGALALVRESGVSSVLFYARNGGWLIVTITLAAVLNLSRFDFAAHPGQLLYWVAYIAVGIGITILLVRHHKKATALQGA